MPDCIFCKIVANEIPRRMVWENNHFIAILNVHPVNPGHLLIIPKQHVETVFEISQPLYNELFETAKVLSTPLQQAMNSKKIGIVVEGFGVSHAHVHLVPINHANDLDSSRAVTLPEEEMNEVGGKIQKQINNTN